MQIGVPRETWPGELRTALVPTNAKKFVKAGFDITIESGTGAAGGFTDNDYQEAGASVTSDRGQILAADVVLRVRKPDTEEVAQYTNGAISISFLDPFNEKALVESMTARSVTGISMEMVPRTTRAQKNGCVVFPG
jgi:NAD(P) transhydrogenase subunit alpha